MRKGRQQIGRLASELGTALEMPDLPEGENDWTHTSRKPSPRRPWKCPHCKTRTAFEWTWRRHIAEVHQPYLPQVSKQPSQRTGSLSCTACPARYNSPAEMEMHHQARHPWLWEE